MDTHNELFNLPHKDLYRKLRDKLQQWAGKKGLEVPYSEYILLLPDLLALLFRLLKHPKISFESKAILGIALVYVLSPLDEAVAPTLLDDIFMIAAALNKILKKEDQDILKELWKGKQGILELIEDTLEIAEELVSSKKAWQKIKKLFSQTK